MLSKIDFTPAVEEILSQYDQRKAIRKSIADIAYDAKHFWEIIVKDFPEKHSASGYLALFDFLKDQYGDTA